MERTGADVTKTSPVPPGAVVGRSSDGVSGASQDPLAALMGTLGAGGGGGGGLLGRFLGGDDQTSLEAAVKGERSSIVLYYRALRWRVRREGGGVAPLKDLSVTRLQFASWLLFSCDSRCVGCFFSKPVALRNASVLAFFHELLWSPAVRHGIPDRIRLLRSGPWPGQAQALYLPLPPPPSPQHDECGHEYHQTLLLPCFCFFFAPPFSPPPVS